VFNVTFCALLITCTFTHCTTIHHTWSEITQLATKYSGKREFKAVAIINGISKRGVYVTQLRVFTLYNQVYVVCRI